MPTRMKNVKIMLFDGSTIKGDTVLDIDNYYYVTNNKDMKVTQVKKNNVAQIMWKESEEFNDHMVKSK